MHPLPKKIKALCVSADRQTERAQERESARAERDCGLVNQLESRLAEGLNPKPEGLSPDPAVKQCIRQHYRNMSNAGTSVIRHVLI